MLLSGATRVRPLTLPYFVDVVLVLVAAVAVVFVFVFVFVFDVRAPLYFGLTLLYLFLFSSFLPLTPSFTLSLSLSSALRDATRYDATSFLFIGDTAYRSGKILLFFAQFSVFFLSLISYLDHSYSEIIYHSMNSSR